MRHAPFKTLSAALLLALTVSACEREAPDPEPVAPAPPAQEKTSILRDDLAIEREPEAPLAPLDLTIGFPDGGTALSDAATAALETALESAQMEAGGRITLSGHTDSTGADAANLRAATRRAEAVRDWLVERGVGEDRIEVIAFGEQNPLAPNARPDGTPDEEGRARNRRVEMTIATLAGTPPASEPADSGTLVDELAGAGES